jgi:hypothetical protein
MVDVGAGGALGVGRATARGAEGEGAAGVSDGFGERRLVGVSSSSGVGFFFALVFPSSFAGEIFFLADVFFFVDFGFGLGDFSGFDSSAFASGVSLGFAFAEALFFFLCGEASIFAFGVGLDEPSASGVSLGFAFVEGLFSFCGVPSVFAFGVGLGDSSDFASDVSLDFAFVEALFFFCGEPSAFAVGVGEVFFLAAFFFGDSSGDGDSVASALRISTGFCFTSSLC